MRDKYKFSEESFIKQIISMVINYYFNENVLFNKIFIVQFRKINKISVSESNQHFNEAKVKKNEAADFFFLILVYRENTVC